MGLSCSLKILWVFLSFLSSEAAVVSVDVHATKSLVDSGHRYLDVR